MKKETLAQVQFCEISKNTFYYSTPLVAVSETMKRDLLFKQGDR